ncbi:uncharacterized protein LOC112091409 [Morus notabilis]|uniref:uncharacterized protein LOC112091409 n=1 Tax=Morus notabilis TaxID=981085 RepID=UPI000CED6156|nr:uncharacterized protein LOC112091409 [Morus notabilis]
MVMRNALSNGGPLRGQRSRKVHTRYVFHRYYLPLFPISHFHLTKTLAPSISLSLGMRNTCSNGGPLRGQRNRKVHVRYVFHRCHRSKPSTRLLRRILGRSVQKAISTSRLGFVPAMSSCSSTGSNSPRDIMWNAGPSNQPNHNEFSDDSDDEYELAAVVVVLWYYYMYMSRPLPRPKHTSTFTGIMCVEYLLDGHEDVIRAKIRMGSECFKRLSSLLELQGYLRPTRNMNVDEQLFIFLYIVCQNSNNRESQDQWQHSGATISKYFKLVLKALCKLRVDFIKPPKFNIIDPMLAAHGSKYLPWFQNCIGALDGTHVPCVPPRADPEVWRNRKGFYSQNVLGVCSFDMKFTYMLARWEGCVHDAQVLASATATLAKKFPYPPNGKYYLVDSGYTNNDCFLAPYRGSTYHLQEYKARRGHPQSERELFNYTHSSLRNCIERTFGVWKGSMNAYTVVNVLNAAKKAATQPEEEKKGRGDSDEVQDAKANRSRRSQGPITRSKKKCKKKATVDDAIEALAKSATLRSETSVQKVVLFQQYLADRQAHTMAAAEAQKEDPTTSIETCMDLLNGYNEYLDDDAYIKAAEILAIDISFRRIFVKIPTHRHLSWIRSL